jgi:hypothetical protein
MSRIPLGVICGLLLGSLDTAMMIPMSFPRQARGYARRVYGPLRARIRNL